MKAVVMLDKGTRRVRVSKNDRVAYAGTCPACRDALLIEVPVDDGDAVCLTCGEVVGRVILDAVVRDGVVRPAGRLA